MVVPHLATRRNIRSSPRRPNAQGILVFFVITSSLLTTFTFLRHSFHGRKSYKDADIDLPWQKVKLEKDEANDLLAHKRGRRGHHLKHLKPDTHVTTDAAIHNQAPVEPAGKENDFSKYYMLFSTSCSPFQDWQSYAFFFHAFKVRQPGDVVRIASGCTAAEEAALTRFHEEHILPMSDRFRLHFTPDYGMNFAEGKKEKEAYKPFNKPFGVRHWMEHVLGFPNRRDADDSIIMILDPDMVLLKPMTGDFSNSGVVWHKTHDGKEVKTQVGHGSPIAQFYEIRAPWREFNLTYIAGENSPARTVSEKDGLDHYPAGPPYLSTGRDMFKIVLKWVEFIGRTRVEFQRHEAEMYAYCIAAAHVGLPHQLATSLMVSSPKVEAEGWGGIDATPPEQVCDAVPSNSLPFVLHYCQANRIGKWFYSKYRHPQNFFSCESPLLAMPPRDVALLYDYYMDPGEVPYGKKIMLSTAQVKRHAFMVCNMISALNEVAMYHKQHHCDGIANLNKTCVFHKIPFEAQIESRKISGDTSHVTVLFDNDCSP